MTSDKYNYFRCSVSQEECGYHVGRICFVKFAKAITKEEAATYVKSHKIKYDDLHIVVDFGMNEEIDSFVNIQNL